MCKFETAIAHTLKFEGGYSDDYSDPGGATNHGVSLRFLRSLGEVERFDHDGDGDLDADDIKKLSRAQAKLLYREHFWNYRYQELGTPLSTKLFDLSVNLGVTAAVKLLQRRVPGLKVDGIYGDKTHARVRWTPPEVATHLLVADAARYYYDICERRSESRKYLFGWLRRAYSLT